MEEIILEGLLGAGKTPCFSWEIPILTLRCTVHAKYIRNNNKYNDEEFSRKMRGEEIIKKSYKFRLYPNKKVGWGTAEFTPAEIGVQPSVSMAQPVKEAGSHLH